MSKLTLKNLFPDMKFTKPDVSVHKALSAFTDMFPEYVLDNTQFAESASSEGEGFEAEMRSYVDNNIDPVYQHSITTWCPLIVDTGPYCSTPLEALIAHSNQRKQNQVESSSKKALRQGEAKRKKNVSYKKVKPSKP